MITKRIKELEEKRGAKLKEASALVNKARDEKRELSSEEIGKVEAFHAEAELCTRSIATEAKQLALESSKAPSLTPSEERDVASFSLTRLINRMANNQPLDGAEAEFAQEGDKEAREAGFAPRGVMVSAKALRRAALARGERRDMTATTANQGGDTVQTNKVGLIDHLFNRNVFVGAGATVLSGLQGNVDLPRAVVGTLPAKKAENAQADEYTATISKLSLQPRRLPTVLEVSNQLLRQSQVAGVDAFLQNHLAKALNQLIETAFIHGGGTNEPTGILATTGIGAVYAGGAATNGTNANGAALVWSDIVNLEKEVAIDNADIGNLAYLTNATQIGKAKATVRVSSTDSMFIVDDRFGRQVNGYQYLTSNNVSAALSKGTSSTLSAWIFGNFADFVIAQWGGIEFLVNPYSKDDYGLTRINAAVYYDGGVIRPVSFAAGVDFTA